MLADCGNVSSERFALAHRRSLTDIKGKTYQDNEMHIWGAPRRVINRSPPVRELCRSSRKLCLKSFSIILLLTVIPHYSHTQTYYSPYPKMGFLLLADCAGRTQNRTEHHTHHSPIITQTHHSDSLITQTRSCSLITQTQSSLRLRRFA
eukprot:8669534-Pyramimonas_sp.AAC.1